ncbi:hypothetical protein Hanom_Chr03g00235501 [Helianthus anomalus]
MPAEPAQHDAPTQIVQVPSIVGGSTATVPEQAAHKDTSATAGGAGAGGSGAGAEKGEGSKWAMSQTPIGPKDTLGISIIRLTLKRLVAMLPTNMFGV